MVSFTSFIILISFCMDLKQKLDHHYSHFDKSKISPDPLQFLHLYSNEKDIEIIGFISSIFAYGNVTQIINSLNKILSIMGNSPYDFIINLKTKDTRKFSGIKHRFYSESDIIKLLLALNSIYKKFGSLKKLFLLNYNCEDENIKNALSHFSNYFLKEINKKNKISLGNKFMFPLPEKGSACKRMNLFLRWMVRKDELDFGLWNEIKTSKLIIPVDTHVARICRNLNLTKRKNVSWAMAEEITKKLKKYDQVDPVKYDFAICHIGMRKMVF